MADEKNVTKGKESWLVRTGRWFKRLPGRIATPFKNMWHELRKVTWPTKQDLMNYAVIVIIFMAVMGVVIGLLDMGASALIKLLIQ